MFAFPPALLARNRHHGTKDTYQLMDRSESTEIGRQPFETEDFGKSTSRLPARPLEPYRRRWTLIGVSVVVVLFSAALIALLRNLKYLLPDPQYYDLLPDESDMSCDLTLPNNNSIENAFIINLRSATHLSFSEAKLIDVTWDLFIGQGGRLLMAWASYRAFMDELVCLLETTAVSYELYVYLAFDTTSLLATWKSTKALFQSKDWHSRIFLIWFGLATIYTLAFPTLMSAATGYVNPSTPSYKMADGTLIDAQSKNLTLCIPVYSGALIGLTNTTIAYGEPVSGRYTGYDAPLPANTSNNRLYNLLYDYYPVRLWMLPNGTNTTTYPNYNYAYNSTLGSQINQCTPSVSSNDYSNSYCQPFNYTTNITVDGHKYVFKNYMFTEGVDYETRRYCYQTELIPSNVEGIARCIQEDYFVWGFSSLLLYIILGLQLAWTIGIFLVWLHANLRSQLIRTGRRIRGNYRAAADLAEAMQETLGDEFCTYSDSEIARELEREGLALRYRTKDVRDTGLSHVGLARSGFFVLDRSKLYGARRRVRG